MKDLPTEKSFKAQNLKKNPADQVKTVTLGCDLEEILVTQNAKVDALQSQTPTVAHQLRTVDLRSDEHAVETKWGRHGSAVRSPTAHLDLRCCAQETFAVWMQ